VTREAIFRSECSGRCALEAVLLNVTNILGTWEWLSEGYIPIYNLHVSCILVQVMRLLDSPEVDV
jgi:hypothetical protein